MRKRMNLRLFDLDASLIDRSGAESLIPEQYAREIIQGVVSESAVLRMGRRLPNMSSNKYRMPVLDMLPMAYFVNGDNGQKQTTKMSWDKKYITAEEIAVIVPIPEAVLEDADYDIWGEVRPRVQEAFGKVIDGAVLFGVEKPASWRDDLVATATKAGSVVKTTADLYADIMGEDGVIAKVEQSGYFVNGHVADISVRAKLRGLKDTTGQPIFKTDMQSGTNYTLDGSGMYFPNNGAFDPTLAKMIVGDWSQLVYAIRQDITFKIFTEGVIQDPSTKAIQYNLMQNDMVALRAVMRLGWEIANPVTAFNADMENPFPFSVYGNGGTVSTVKVTPATASLAAGGSKLFTAAVTGNGIVSDSVSWSVSGGAKANTKITEDGLLTVDKAETASSLTVTAESKQDASKSGTASVTLS